MMTRADVLAKVRWQFMEIAADHQADMIVSLWADGFSLSEIQASVEFSNNWNAEAIAETLQQVEKMIDAHAGT